MILFFYFFLSFLGGPQIILATDLFGIQKNHLMPLLLHDDIFAAR